MTGANNTNRVLKAYICQYAPDGYGAESGIRVRTVGAEGP